MELSDQENAEMEGMDNREIAEHIAAICYMSKSSTDNIRHVTLAQLMAVQLLMERVVLSPEDDDYTEEEMADKIEEYTDYMASSMADVENTDEKELEDVDLAALNTR